VQRIKHPLGLAPTLVVRPRATYHGVRGGGRYPRRV